MPRTQRSRGRRRPLTRDGIADAALRIIDDEGLDALSMRRLGQVLSYEAMAIYRHFGNKRDLLSGVVERLWLEWDVPEPSQRQWRERVHDAFESYAELAYRHPRAFPLLTDRSLFAVEATRRAERMYAVLNAGGFDPEATLLAVVTLGSYADGFLLEQIASAEANCTGSSRRASLVDGETPLLAAVEPYKRYVYSADGYHEAIDVILDGLVQRRLQDRTRR